MRRRRLRIVITAGPTREPLDSVRYLSNYSTGYMGAQLAAVAQRRGHCVTVIHGPISERLPRGVRTIAVERAQELEQALRSEARRADAILMAAAVADFRPARIAAAKLPRRGRMALRLQATPDIIGRMPRRPGQIVAGFALESGDAVRSAKHKLREKQLDLVLAQRAGKVVPFGRRRVQAWLVSNEGRVNNLGRISKGRIARLILDKVEGLWYGQHHHA